MAAIALHGRHTPHMHMHALADMAAVASHTSHNIEAQAWVLGPVLNTQHPPPSPGPTPNTHLLDRTNTQNPRPQPGHHVRCAHCILRPTAGGCAACVVLCGELAAGGAHPHPSCTRNSSHTIPYTTRHTPLTPLTHAPCTHAQHTTRHAPPRTMRACVHHPYVVRHRRRRGHTHALGPSPCTTT